MDSADYAEGDAAAFDNFRAGYATGAALILSQAKGLLTKRALQTYRTFFTYFVMVGSTK